MQQEDSIGRASSDQLALSFHFAFVDAGKLAEIPAAELTRAMLTGPLAIRGPVETPPDAVNGVLAQAFLLEDAEGKGALVQARMVFAGDGSATFTLDDPSALPFDSFKAPIQIHGNVVEVTRGETVPHEVLGSGDARTIGQRFKLKKKPLTYLPSRRADVLAESTLEVRVNGLLWREVPSFYGAAPDDEVYVVRHDDDQEAFVIFGDGVHGARLPSGVRNVVARYRFGSGFAAPPAGSLTQLVKPIAGIRAIRQPVAATPGRDPDSIEDLRTLAPKVALMLNRAVSAADFEALAQLAPGVRRASARFGWIAQAHTAGMSVRYLGEADQDTVRAFLSSRADPTLTLHVEPALPVWAKLALTVEVSARFDPVQVADQVQKTLLHPEDGLLSLRRIPIDAALSTSALYEAVLAVPGVVGVSAATLESAAVPSVQSVPGGTGSKLTSALHGSLCAPRGHYFDFTRASHASGVVVSGRLASAEPPTGGRHG